MKGVERVELRPGEQVIDAVRRRLRELGDVDQAAAADGLEWDESAPSLRSMAAPSAQDTFRIVLRT